MQCRCDRLARAVASFDAATIATTHGFCQEVLGGLGVAGDLEPDVDFVEDLSDLVAEVTDDLYVRRFHGDDSPALTLSPGQEIARVAIDNAGAEIVSSGSDAAQMRGRLAKAVRDEFEDRKRRLSVMNYDDLVTRLQSRALGSGRRGGRPRAAQPIRGRAGRRVPGHRPRPVGHHAQARSVNAGVTLVLIADPKQAIYAFRGADVYAYLEAAASASDRSTLGVNWRSDQGLINAHDALLAGVKLGHQGIAYRHVQAAPAHRARACTEHRTRRRCASGW